METIKFHFDTQYAAELRAAVNDRIKQSIDNVHDEKQTNGSYRAWNRTCAAMDRLEDTLSYLNELELRKNRNFRSAFDFYDFINNAYIVIDCIKTIGHIFRIDEKLIKEIETSTEVFGTSLSAQCTDQKYFEYIRALCSVHPLCTNHQPELLRGSQFHCCPFVSWKGRSTWNSGEYADLTACIYPANGEGTFHIGLYVSQFEQYLTKWIDFIPKIIEAKNTYTDKEYEKMRMEQVKDLSDFENDVVQYLAYLKGEYCKRLDYGNDYVFDEYIHFFTIKLSDSRNQAALEKYQNAVAYSLQFMKNELQNMSYEGYENNGIKYPERGIETTLFELLDYIPIYEGSFSAYGYNLQKVYYLGSDGIHHEYDKMYARQLLEEPKELINRYVYFTNTEPDAERIILVRLAVYLDALLGKNLLNKNIPNTLDFRMQILSDEQFAELLEEIEEDDAQVDSNVKKLLELIEQYGG